MSFSPGDIVNVRDDWPETRGPVHIRTPHFVRGKTGRIVRRLGEFPNPEKLAFAQPAEPSALYHVSFALPALWPEATRDELLVELYEHWLVRS